jgi:hypothetical protein
MIKEAREVGMYRTVVVTMSAALLASATFAAPKPAAPVVQVFKSASCGCCSKWIEHMRTSGFDVRATNVDDMAAVKTAYRVPGQLESCHTAAVDGYAIEGHVPAWDVRRLLKERLPVAGIAAPGMPAGSPGMEIPGTKPRPFNVMSFDAKGKTAIFAKY